MWMWIFHMLESSPFTLRFNPLHPLFYILHLHMNESPRSINSKIILTYHILHFILSSHLLVREIPQFWKLVLTIYISSKYYSFVAMVGSLFKKHPSKDKGMPFSCQYMLHNLAISSKREAYIISIFETTLSSRNTKKHEGLAWFLC